MGEIERATLTAQMAKDYLGISYWTLLKMVREKKIPHIKVGNLVLFRQEALDIWLKEQESLSVANDYVETESETVKEIQE